MKKFKEIIIKHSFVSVYLVPLVILVLPFLFKFISEKSLLINPSITLIQSGLAFVWLVRFLTQEPGKIYFTNSLVPGNGVKTQ